MKCEFINNGKDKVTKFLKKVKRYLRNIGINDELKDESRICNAKHKNGHTTVDLTK